MNFNIFFIFFYFFFFWGGGGQKDEYIYIFFFFFFGGGGGLWRELEWDGGMMSLNIFRGPSQNWTIFGSYF